MSAEDQSAVSDATEQTETQEKVSEQSTQSYGDELLKVAAESGYEIGEPKPRAEPEPETEPELPGAEEVEETTLPEETEEPEEEEAPSARKDEWPESAKARIAEESSKRKRANERADNAEAQIQALQAQLAQSVGPAPTERDPFIDVQDTVHLDKLERQYDRILELADDNPDAVIEQAVEAEKKNSGKDLLEKFSPEQILAMAKRKSEKALRKQIPERRTYLQQRAVADQQALEAYPELKDTNSEFTKAAGFLAHSLLTGQAMKAPDALIWVARAVRGYQMETQGNGQAPKAKTPEAQRVLAASRQKIAPTPTRTRSMPERRGSANLDKLAQKLEKEGTKESAEDYVAAMFSQRGGSRRSDSIAE